MDAKDLESAILQLREGKVGVIPTDTIYGLVASVHNPEAIERIYTIKGRHQQKPCIVLIGNDDHLNDLDIDLDYEMREALEDIWPGPNSVILPTSAPSYLHRDTWSLAVRLPAIDWLNELVDLVGPIVATSANSAGSTPKQEMTWIKNNLSDLDFYYEGRVQSEPSALYLYDNGVLIQKER